MRACVTAVVLIAALATASSVLAKDVYVSISGSSGVFRTDTRILNPSRTKDIILDATFLPVGKDNTDASTRQIAIPRRQMAVFDDVVTSLFGASGLGAIRLSSPDNFIATSRIYATAGSSTLGHLVPGLDSTAAQSEWGIASAQIDRPRRQVGTSRANIGFVNINSSQTAVTIRRYDRNNVAVGQPIIQTIQPFSVTFRSRSIPRTATSAMVG